MKREIRKIMAGASVMAIALSTSKGADERAPITWSRLPPLPDSLGVAGAFAGVSGGALMVAGGANFPGKMPWEGGKKVWHDTVYALERTNGSWRVIGRLPRPLAYGVSLTVPEGVLCVGGSDVERHYADTSVLVYSRGTLEVKSLAPLPIPLANGAGALVGNVAYVAAGSDQPGERSALNRLFALDLAKAAPAWTELEPCPGAARILPVAAAVNGAFYLAGGAALRPADGTVKRVYLRDAWRFTPGKSWQRLPDLPKPCVAAASPAPVLDAMMLLVGGDDGSLVGFQPPAKHPGFPKGIQALDVREEKWKTFGEAPVGRATLPSVEWNGMIVLPSGEMRPGVRSPEIWTFHTNGTH